MQTNSKFKSAVVWSQNNCAWCERALKLLEQRGIHQVVEKKIGVNTAKEEFMEKNPGARTVPQVWIDGKHIGGFEDLQKYLNDNA